MTDDDQSSQIRSPWRALGKVIGGLAALLTILTVIISLSREDARFVPWAVGLLALLTTGAIVDHYRSEAQRFLRLYTHAVAQLQQPSTADVATFDLLERDLDGPVHWLRDNDLFSPFARVKLDPFIAWHDQSRRPDREFLDDQLETYRGKLRSAIQDLLDATGRHHRAHTHLTKSREELWVEVPHEHGEDHLVTAAEAAILPARKQVIESFETLQRAAIRRLRNRPSKLGD